MLTRCLTFPLFQASPLPHHSPGPAPRRNPSTDGESVATTRLRKHPLICGVVAVLACVLADTCANAQGNDLIMASSNGDLPPVRALLAAGSDVNVNAKRSDGAAALGVASQQGHVEAVQPLLAAQADGNANPGLAQAQTPAPVNTGFDAVRATWRVGINVKEPDPNKTLASPQTCSLYTRSS